MKLQEIYKDNKIDVIEELSKGNTMTLSASFCKVGVKNLNGRTYSEEIIKREVKRLNKKIQKENSILSSSGHPRKELEIKDVSHQICALWFDEDSKEGKCTLEIIPTTSGKNTMTILNHKGSLGISMRGKGSVDKAGNIKSDYELLGCDIVTSPSFGDITRFSKQDVIGESLEIDRTEKKAGELTAKEAKVKLAKFNRKLKRLYESSLEAGCNLTFTEFSRKFKDKAVKILEKILVEDEK